MEDKVSKISTLETQIKIYSFIGWGFVVMALLPIGNVAIDVFIKSKPWPEAELGSFLGGVSGAFAALAGVFFVFVAFLGQRISIIQQQIEIQNNIQELRDTRQEIQGQREQLELQNKQFQTQSFERVFFDLLSFYRVQSQINFSEDYGDEPLKGKISGFSNYYRNSFTSNTWASEIPNNQIEFLKKSFDSKLSKGFARVRSFVEITINVLLHIEQNKELIDTLFYKNVFRSSLNIYEQRVIFYAFFSINIWLEPSERQIFKAFLTDFTPQNLLDPSHKTLLSAFDE